jgi:hypothetical protein
VRFCPIRAIPDELFFWRFAILWTPVDTSLRVAELANVQKGISLPALQRLLGHDHLDYRNSFEPEPRARHQGIIDKWSPTAGTVFFRPQSASATPEEPREAAGAAFTRRDNETLGVVACAVLHR